MLIALPLAAAGLMLAAPAALNQADPAPASQAAAMAASPLVGTWSLDVAKIPAEERPREVTIEFGTTADGKWATHVRIEVGPRDLKEGNVTIVRRDTGEKQTVPVDEAARQRAERARRRRILQRLYVGRKER